jgi:hypothetical protein
MRALARKGGAVTKRRHANQPRYYRDISRLGSAASVASRKAKIAATLETAAIAEAPTADPINTLADTTHVTQHMPVTIADVLADRERFGPHRPEISERQKILDDIAQERLARVIARVLEADETEPWDPWS